MVPRRSAAVADFAPIENEPPLRWCRRLRLVPADGLGARRRALFLAMLTWLPIAVWAVWAGSTDGAASGESLLHHYGVHVRCLIVIPLLILAEPMLHRKLKSIAAKLAQTAVVDPLMRERFNGASAGVVRLWDASLPWLLAIGVAIAWTLADRPHGHEDAMSWALDASGTLGFGGWWFGFVVRIVFLALLLGWLWRLLLITWWFWRIGRLELSLVPTLVLWVLLMLLPLLGLMPALQTVRARSTAAYADLVGKQGRLVHRRWIEGRKVEDEPILDAPEIGNVAAAAVMYEAVKKMRRLPVGKSALLKIIVPLAIPLVLAAALQIPLKGLLLKLAKALL